MGAILDYIVLALIFVWFRLLHLQRNAQSINVYLKVHDRVLSSRYTTN